MPHCNVCDRWPCACGAAEATVDDGYLVARDADGHHTVQGDGCEGDEVRRYSGTVIVGGPAPAEHVDAFPDKGDEPASTLAGEIRGIRRHRALGAIAAMISAGRGGILGQVNDAPVTEPPIVQQARAVRFTRRPPAHRKPALDELTPAQRWRVDGTPFRGKRQIERQQRQAARVLERQANNAVGSGITVPTETTHATDLMACPRCNQYNQRTNYECRVCGFEFGLST